MRPCPCLGPVGQRPLSEGGTGPCVTTRLQGDCEVRAAGGKPKETSFLRLQGDSARPSCLPPVPTWHGADQLDYPFKTVTVLARGENGQPRRGQSQVGTASFSVGYKQLSLVSVSPHHHPSPLHFSSAYSQKPANHEKAWASLFPSPMTSASHSRNASSSS